MTSTVPGQDPKFRFAKISDFLRERSKTQRPFPSSMMAHDDRPSPSLRIVRRHVVALESDLPA